MRCWREGSGVTLAGVDADVAAVWDAEYAAGRYSREAPAAFIRDVLTAARQRGLRRGLYIGCGNGRNLVPMVDAGLDLTGLDLAGAAEMAAGTAASDCGGR